MTKRKYILIAGGLLLVLVLAFGVNAFLSSRPRTVRIEVSGTAGQEIEATFEVDGVSNKERSVLPAEFSFKANKVSYSIEKSDRANQEQITVDVYVNGVKRNSASAVRGVRGEVEYGINVMKNSIAGVN